MRIGTIVKDNVSLRCDGCLEIIEGTPWRMNILDVVAAETPVNWTERPPINPGPFEFHPDAGHAEHRDRPRVLLGAIARDLPHRQRVPAITHPLGR